MKNVLQNKTAVITGASKGLGRSLAALFVSLGANVVINARNQEEIDGVAHDIGAHGFAGDVTIEADMRALADFAMERFGSLEYWVNNAGIWIPHCPIQDLPMERVRQMVEVNLYGTMHGARAALAHMVPAKSGTIVNILSTSALEGRAGSAGYCASKYAAVGFCKSLRKEVVGDGIKVFNVYPGGMKTNLFDEQKHEAYDSFMEPDDVALRMWRNLKSKNAKEEFVIKRKK